MEFDISDNLLFFSSQRQFRKGVFSSQSYPTPCRLKLPTHLAPVLSRVTERINYSPFLCILSIVLPIFRPTSVIICLPSRWFHYCCNNRITPLVLITSMHACRSTYVLVVVWDFSKAFGQSGIPPFSIKCLIWQFQKTYIIGFEAFLSLLISLCKFHGEFSQFLTSLVGGVA